MKRLFLRVWMETSIRIYWRQNYNFLGRFWKSTQVSNQVSALGVAEEFRRRDLQDLVSGTLQEDMAPTLGWKGSQSLDRHQRASNGCTGITWCSVVRRISLIWGHRGMLGNTSNYNCKEQMKLIQRALNVTLRRVHVTFMSNMFLNN